MTENELRTAYDRMSLSEERLSELEKRFVDSVKTGAHDGSAGMYADAFMNFDHEYRPEPKKKKPLRTALISTAAAAAVIAVGVTAAFKGGLIPVQQTQPAESGSQTSEADAGDILNVDDLPRYENRDINCGEVSLNTDYAVRAELDSQNGNIYRTQLVAEFTVTNCLGAIDDSFSVYEVTVDECFLNLTGLEQQGRSIHFVVRGTESNQSVGCPVYSIGDRILAALYCTDGEYRLSAEFALSDIITVDGKDYAAVRSSVLGGLPIANYPIENHSGGDAVEYPTTTNVNPAKYYGFYDPQAFAEYLVEKAQAAQKTKQPLQGTFDMSELDFRTDKEAMKIFETWFIGSWLQYSADERKVTGSEYLQYRYDTVFDLSPGGMTCGGFAANADNTAFFMLRGESKSDYNSLWVVMKNDPERMFVYDYSEDNCRSFAEYSYHYWNGNGSEQDALGQTAISRLGIMKFLAEADDPALSEAVYDLFENAEADFAGKHWKRVPVSADTFGDLENHCESNKLDITDPEHPVIYVDLYDAETPWKSLEPGGTYEGVIKRSFIAEFSESGGKWTYTLTPQSGDINDIENFWSPLKNYGFYPLGDWRTGAEPEELTGSDIELEYRLVQDSDGAELYIVRRYSTTEGRCDDVYWWNQQLDLYEFIANAEHISVMDNGGSLFVISRFNDNEAMIYEYVQESCMNTEYIDYTDAAPEIYFRGKYILITKHIPSDGTIWLVTDRHAWNRVETYADSEFTLTDDGFITNKDGKTVVYNNSSDNIESALLSLDSQARRLWFDFVVNDPDWMGWGFETEVNGKTQWVCEIRNKDWRTRDGMLAAFGQVYTHDVAEEALRYVTGRSVIEYNGAMYSMMGGRGVDPEISEVIPEVTWENPEGTQAEITYTVSYNDDEHGGSTGKTDTYTINAVKEADGWRLDRFYYPY